MWEQIILTSALGILSAFKRSPHDVPKFKSLLVHILNDVSGLLGVQPPTVP